MSLPMLGTTAAIWVFKSLMIVRHGDITSMRRNQSAELIAHLRETINCYHDTQILLMIFLEGVIVDYRVYVLPCPTDITDSKTLSQLLLRKNMLHKDYQELHHKLNTGRVRKRSAY
ncbi:hypothetical protein AVEN_24313-1 [Araneus ventricosus]|uniref:Uncharacterized protein n=1 Tax=Araneus ventricosus TaxID=182803 RepID=A0A4Y2PEB8_ARAVE|nr:hypothetical protein AVEN_24313-1 [Araneus ventricosus]